MVRNRLREVDQDAEHGPINRRTYLNQFYRPGWQTRRTNTFAYLKADWSLSEATSVNVGAYVHRHRGRGDWLPPYIADVTDDGGGPESELMGVTPVRGGAQLGLIRFVNQDGVAVGPAPGCTSSYRFNCRVGGGAHRRARLRPPLKRYVRFSRIPLSQGCLLTVASE